MAPPTQVMSAGTSPRTSQTMAGASGVSSAPIKAERVAETEAQAKGEQELAEAELRRAEQDQPAEVDGRHRGGRRPRPHDEGAQEGRQRGRGQHADIAVMAHHHHHGRDQDRHGERQRVAQQPAGPSVGTTMTTTPSSATPLATSVARRSRTPVHAQAMAAVDERRGGVDHQDVGHRRLRAAR